MTLVHVVAIHRNQPSLPYISGDLALSLCIVIYALHPTYAYYLLHIVVCLMKQRVQWAILCQKRSRTRCISETASEPRCSSSTVRPSARARVLKVTTSCIASSLTGPSSSMSTHTVRMHYRFPRISFLCILSNLHVGSMLFRMRRHHLTRSCASSSASSPSDRSFLMLSNHLCFGIPLLLIPRHFHHSLNITVLTNTPYSICLLLLPPPLFPLPCEVDVCDKLPPHSTVMHLISRQSLLPQVYIHTVYPPPRRSSFSSPPHPSSSLFLHIHHSFSRHHFNIRFCILLDISHCLSL